MTPHLKQFFVSLSWPLRVVSSILDSTESHANPHPSFEGGHTESQIIANGVLRFGTG